MHVRVAFAGPVPHPPALLVGQLRMFVVDGVVPAGTRIRVSRVADLLECDEDTAWMVLLELGRDGFLERVDDDTVRVRPDGATAQDETVQIRHLLEPAAARAAAAHARPVDLITLGHLVERVEEAVEARDYIAFRRAEDALVATLLGLHPNAELARLCTELRLRTAYDGLRVPLEQGLLGRSLRRHRELLDLIAVGDLDGVETLIRTSLDVLHFVGAPRMDAPHLVGLPLTLVTDDDLDGEFLDITED